MFPPVLREETGSSLWINKRESGTCGRPQEGKGLGRVKKEPTGRNNPPPLHMIQSNLATLFTLNGSVRRSVVS